MHIIKHNQKMLVSSLFIVKKGFYFTISLSSFFQVRYQKSFIQIRKQIWVKFHIKRMKKSQLIRYARKKTTFKYLNIKTSDQPIYKIGSQR